MGRSVKDPRVTTGAGTALSAAKVAELTAASEAEAKRLVVHERLSIWSVGRRQTSKLGNCRTEV